MRLLVTWGSKRGGTEGIGQILGAALKTHGFEVVTAPADAVKDLDSFDAVIIGGALYANRWPGNVRRFVGRNVTQLRKRPVWFFSSGPLDNSAEGGEIPAPMQIAVLAERIGARGHVTFGGRLAPDAKGFPASAMAKNKSGDFRNPAQIRKWAAELSALLPDAKPAKPVDHPARSIPRLLAHGIAGSGLCAALMAVLLLLPSLTMALILHALAAPIFFTAIAWHYFRARGAREPLPTALTWTAMVALFDLAVIASMVPGGPEMWKSILGAGLSLALTFLASWISGLMVSMLPGPKPTEKVRLAQAATSG